MIIRTASSDKVLSGVLNTSILDTEPSVFTAIAQENGIQGKVTISFVVNTDGSVSISEKI